MSYWQLFLSFFQIGLFSIGGGYATLPLIQQEIVQHNQWLTPQAFSDIVTISQMTPGPLAVNSATFVGLQLNGIFGAIVATFACVISGCLISLLLARFFNSQKDSLTIQRVFSGLKASTIGLIASASLSIITLAFAGVLNWQAVRQLQLIPIFLFAVAFFLLRKKIVSPITLLILAGLAGLIIY